MNRVRDSDSYVPRDVPDMGEPSGPFFGSDFQPPVSPDEQNCELSVASELTLVYRRGRQEEKDLRVRR